MIASFRSLFQTYYRQGLLVAIVWFILAGINGLAPLALAITTLLAFWIGAWMWRASVVTFGLRLPKVNRPFSKTTRRDQVGIFVGALLGVGLAVWVAWQAWGQQTSVINLLIGWGILLALVGGWVGLKLSGGLTKLTLPAIKVSFGWLAGSKLVTLLTAIGAGLGVANVWPAADFTASDTLFSLLARFLVWMVGLGSIGYWLGLVLLRYNGLLWKLLLAVKTSPRWWMLLGAVLAVVLGTTTLTETAVSSDAIPLPQMTPTTLFNLLMMGVVGWFIVRWVFGLKNTLIRTVLFFILAGVVGGVVVVSLLPIPITSISELLLAGGLAGTAVALLLFRLSSTIILRGLVGALLGALVAVGNNQQDASQIAVTSWIFIGVIGAVLFSVWKEPVK